MTVMDICDPPTTQDWGGGGGGGGWNGNAKGVCGQKRNVSLPKSVKKKVQCDIVS